MACASGTLSNLNLGERRVSKIACNLSDASPRSCSRRLATPRWLSGDWRMTSLSFSNAIELEGWRFGSQEAGSMVSLMILMSDWRDSTRERYLTPIGASGEIGRVV